ncbi:MAG: hypothetical protein AAB592_01445, partial [Patescibacteria group bacterium]
KKLPAVVSDIDDAREIASVYDDYTGFKNDEDAVRAVATMVSNNLMIGYGAGSTFEGQFGAYQPMTRNMLIAVMVRAADLMDFDPCAAQE